QEVDDLRLFDHCLVHATGDPRDAFHAMTQVDVLISGTSAFSLTAGKIATGVKLVRRSWDRHDYRLHLPRTSDWMDVDGNWTAAAVWEAAARHRVERLRRRA
ncbi:MAG: hypothetical protein KC492_26695, partial [Myxococcales bacterium]|nr:hypothetical protein [Myxococcales bacterium]